MIGDYITGFLGLNVSSLMPHQLILLTRLLALLLVCLAKRITSFLVCFAGRIACDLICDPRIASFMSTAVCESERTEASSEDD